MRVLHTADWHIGRTLYGKKRYEEFSSFLNWLLEAISEHCVDVLLVSGDVFDTTTPSNRAQSLYYDFISRVGKTCCRHVVVTGGNHDSPSFLNAPQALLKALRVQVIGAMPDNLEDEVIVLSNNEDVPEAIVCAVPYLRDRDLRTAEPGDTIEDKNLKLVQGLAEHYATVSQIAEAKQIEIMKAGFPKIPIIGMGHLFTSGGRTEADDGVRELYVGTLVHVGKEIFPKAMDYVALGHLHVPQLVGKSEYVRYSGSPIPMGYGEAKQQKQVLLLEFEAGTTQPNIVVLPIPRFQELVSLKGGLEIITKGIAELKKANSKAWLEIEYNGNEVMGNLREVVDEAVAGSQLEVRRLKNLNAMQRVIHANQSNETLDDLTPEDVFQKCLEAKEVPKESRADLVACYKEILQTIQEKDINAD